MQKKNIILTNNLLTHVVYRGYMPKLHSVFCHKKYALIKSNSLLIRITSKTHFVQITLHTSHESINNSARITSRTCCFHYTPTIIIWTFKYANQYMYVMVYSSFIHTSVSWFRRITLRFSCGTEETHVCKISCTCQYSVQDKTHIKAYHLHNITESFKIYFQEDN